MPWAPTPVFGLSAPFNNGLPIPVPPASRITLRQGAAEG
jgi:hypothetical protein